MLICFVYMFWTVQINPIAIVAIVFLLTVIASVEILISRRKEANYDSGSSNKYQDVMVDGVKQNIGEEKYVKEFMGLFEEFRQSRLYAEIAVALASDNVIQERNLIELKTVLYEFFIEFRLYLYEIGPKLSDTDIDYCILVLAGIKQKHIYKLIGITPSGIRLKKMRIKEKVPARVYWNIFGVEHCIY